MLLTMRLLDWQPSTLTIRPLRLTPSFSKCWIEKKRKIRYAVQQIRLVIWLTMYFASVYYLGFNKKLLFFFT